MKVNAMSAALQGLQQSKERLNNAAVAVAQGDISADTAVETKIAVRDVQAQLKTIKVLDEVEQNLLDTIA